MRAMVVFESMFGNTKDVAQAVADGLRRSMDVILVEVGEAAPSTPPDVVLLVVGGAWLFGRAGARVSGFEALLFLVTSVLAFQAVRNAAWLAAVSPPLRSISFTLTDISPAFGC